jgi:hypothetical protein
VEKDFVTTFEVKTIRRNIHLNQKFSLTASSRVSLHSLWIDVRLDLE